MKKMTITIALLFNSFLISYASIDNNFRIQNDLFYEEVYSPARTVEVIETVDEIINSHAMIYSDEKGNVQKIILFPAIIDSIDNLIEHKENYIFFQSELKNNRRYVFMYEQESNSWVSVAEEEWLSPYEVIAKDIAGVKIIMTKSYSNPNGSIKRMENTYLSNPEDNEVLNYYYLTEDEQKPQSLIDNLKEGEKLIFVTTFEVDEKGSWTKRQEEEYGGKIKVQTRIIDYIK